MVSPNDVVYYTKQFSDTFKMWWDLYVVPERGVKYCNKRVCLSVCLLLVVVGCVLDDILGTTRPNFTKFLCMLPVVVACSSSIGVVLPVLTSYFHMAHCLYTYNSTVVPPRHKVTIEHY